MATAVRGMKSILDANGQYAAVNKHLGSVGSVLSNVRRLKHAERGTLILGLALAHPEWQL